MMCAIDLLHISGDEEKSLQVNCEEDGEGVVKWNDLPVAACTIMQKLFTV